MSNSWVTRPVRKALWKNLLILFLSLTVICPAKAGSAYVTGFLPICQNQIQGLFKDFQKGPYEGYIRRTKLNQTGTFISIYKQVQFTFDNLSQGQTTTQWREIM